MIAYNAVKLFDLDYGSRMVSVTTPDCLIAASSTIRQKDRGKAPGALTLSGWVGINVNEPKYRCPKYETAKLWNDEWNANVGFVVGDGYIAIDNDQGAEFSEVFRSLVKTPLPRRFVADPKHTRDAFLVRVLDFVGDPADVPNRDLKFTHGTRTASLQILAKSKQFVIAGVHPDTRSAYVWENELPALADIPVISEDELWALIEKFIEKVSERGWSSRIGPLGSSPAPVSAPAAAVSAAPRLAPASLTNPVNTPVKNHFDEARALLAQIPNRDLPAGAPRTAIDIWLDEYSNWINVAYALVAFLGVLAKDPEALQVWLEWSDGRGQGQASESVWRSAVATGSRFGQLGLVKLVRSLVPAIADFPDFDETDAAAFGGGRPVWDQLRENWAFCASKGFVDLRNGEVASRQAFSDKNAHFAPALRRELGLPSKSKTSVVDMFLSQKERQEVKDITYAPGDPRLIPTKNPLVPVFNRWLPTDVPARDVSVLDVKPWLDHLLFVLGSAQEVERFLRWCAFVVQQPRLKPNWHYMIMSVQGLGKDTMLSPLKLAVGKGNWKEELIYSLANNFNAVIEHKLLIVGETSQPKQGFVSAHDYGTKLKPLLAQPPEFLEVNRKFMQPYEIPNRVAVVLFSNEENPLHLERGQRRVHVVNRREQKTESIDYYGKLHDWLKSGGNEQAASYLLSYPLKAVDIREFSSGVAPDTDDKDELEQLNTHPQLAVLEDLIDDARNGIRDGTPHTLVATSEELSQLIKARGNYKPSARFVSSWLLDMEKRGKGVRRLKIDPKQPRVCGSVQVPGYSARLWLLSDTTADGRYWKNLTNTEIVAIWKNLPAPKNATVLPLRSNKAGDYPDDVADEKV